MAQAAVEDADEGGSVRRPTLRADDIALQVVAEVAVSVVGAVSEKRSTWRHWNLSAEASRSGSRCA